MAQKCKAYLDAVEELNIALITKLTHMYNWRIFHILFCGFLLLTRSQIKHNIIRGLFTITITNYTISPFSTGSIFFVCL
jgi:hypothetical protein